MSMSTLTGKSALVTGSTSGIGLGIAGRLAAAGANVVLNGFGDPHAIEEIRRGLAEPNHVEVRYCEADLVDPAQIRRLVAFATEAFGQVDILVNNAGVQHVAPIVEFPDDRWDHVLAVNLSAVFHCTKEVLPGMLARDWGRVINIASAHGLVASINKAAYVASKHGVVGLTKVAALETAQTGVTVNAIAPGWVLTPLVEAQIRARAEAEGKSFEQAKNRAARREAALAAVRDPRADRRPRRLPVQPRRRPDPRADDRDRRRVDGTVSEHTSRVAGNRIFEGGVSRLAAGRSLHYREPSPAARSLAWQSISMIGRPGLTSTSRRSFYSRGNGCRVAPMPRMWFRKPSSASGDHGIVSPTLPPTSTPA